MTPILNSDFNDGLQLSADVLNPNTQDVLFSAGTVLTFSVLAKMLSLGITEIPTELYQ